MKTQNVSDKSNLLLTSLMAVPACQRHDGDIDWFPAVDVIEAGQEYVFEVDLPGLKPEEIQVRVDSDGLFIGGQRVLKRQSGKTVRVERPSGAFVRHLPLPPDVYGEIHGIFSDGVLELHMRRASPDSEPEQSQALVRAPEEVAP